MANFSVTHTETHDETKPAGSRARSLGDDDIREYKRTMRERLAVDHEFLADESSNTNIGTHKKISFTEVQGSDPTSYDDTSYLYIKTVGSENELFYMDTAGNVTQLTTAGIINLDNGRLTNGQYLRAIDAAGTGTVDLIKADTNDVPVVPDGTETATNAAPTSDKDLANKKYVDDQDNEAAGGDLAGNYPNPTLSTTVFGMEDYGSSNSASNTKSVKDLKICYGKTTINATSSVSITNLPFTSSTSYVAMAIISKSSTSSNNGTINRASASQIDIYNSSGNPEDYLWIAIGT